MNKSSETLYVLNKLSSNHLSKEEFIGLMTLAIYSKEIFLKNSELDIFIESFFNIKYKPYVISSRTLICARLLREIHAYDDSRIKDLLKILRGFFSMLLESDQKKFEKNKLKKGVNANSDLSTWISGILRKK